MGGRGNLKQTWLPAFRNACGGGEWGLRNWILSILGVVGLNPVCSLSCPSGGRSPWGPVCQHQPSHHQTGRPGKHARCHQPLHQNQRPQAQDWWSTEHHQQCEWMLLLLLSLSPVSYAVFLIASWLIRFSCLAADACRLCLSVEDLFVLVATRHWVMKSWGQRSFCYQAPVIWNQLPVSVCQSALLNLPWKPFSFQKPFLQSHCPEMWLLVCMCVCVFMLYALNFDNMYL